MSLNIKSKAVAETSFLHLKDAQDNLMYTEGDKKNDKKPVGVNVFGPGSREYQAAQSKLNNRMVQRLQKRGKFEQSSDEKQKEHAQHLAEITHSFVELDYDGLTGRDLALAVYGDRSIGFIADQVAEHVKDWSNFTQSSQTI